MPGAIQTGNELGNSAIALDQEMRGHLQLADRLEEGVLAGRQVVLEELLDLAGPVAARRQTDVVNDQQRNLAIRALVEIR